MYRTPPKDDEQPEELDQLQTRPRSQQKQRPTAPRRPQRLQTPQKLQTPQAPYHDDERPEVPKIRRASLNRQGIENQSPTSQSSLGSQHNRSGQSGRSQKYYEEPDTDARSVPSTPRGQG